MIRSVTSLILTLNLLLLAYAPTVSPGTMLSTDVTVPALPLAEFRLPGYDSVANAKQVPTIVTVSKDPSAPGHQTIQVANQTPSSKRWLWYSIPIAVIILVLLTIGALGFLWHRREVERIHQAAKPSAHLVLQGHDETRYPIMASTWRIGRSKHNEVVLKHHSISSRHAEIHQTHHGGYRIVDLDSLNGIYVNDKKVKSCSLAEGDIIDMGDVRLRFTFDAGDYPVEEATLRLHTKGP